MTERAKGYGLRRMSSLPPPVLEAPEAVGPPPQPGTEPRPPYLTDGRLRAIGALLAAIGASVVALALFQEYDAPDAAPPPVTQPFVTTTTAATTATTSATSETSGASTESSGGSTTESSSGSTTTSADAEPSTTEPSTSAAD